jgi:murein L,D-transpeptidase YafK
MTSLIVTRVRRRAQVLAAAGLLAVALSACAKFDLSPALMPLSKESMMLLGRKNMTATAPMFIRIFKEESELEVWKQREDGHYYHFKTYPICNWSGAVGPKIQQGDMQAPEGFYKITQWQLNPNSQFHLAFNLGYPNAFDRANKRDGDFLMIHGRCKSAGCYAMTDVLMEEIYALARESFIGGQDAIQVHAFPFRLTDENMKAHAGSPHIKFWATLKDGYDYFEQARLTPTVGVCERRYVVNVAWKNGPQTKVDPEGPCPAFERPPAAAFTPLPGDKTAEERVMVPGAKTRAATYSPAPFAPVTSPASAATYSKAFGLGAAFDR